MASLSLIWMGDPHHNDTLNPSLTAGREPCPTNLVQWVAMASLSLSEAAKQTGATPETVATNDVAVAFAALRVELTGLLGRTAEVRANEQLREDQDNHENRSLNQLDVVAGDADHPREEAAPSTTIDKTEKPIPTPTNEEVVETPRKRSWWRRLVPWGMGIRILVFRAHDVRDGPQPRFPTP
jgi:hypothetical protein